MGIKQLVKKINRKLSSDVGIETNVGDIPVAIVDNHHKVFYFWYMSGIKSAELYHIDNHHDMCNGARYVDELTEDYYKRLHISDFILPAIHHGIVSSVYHLDPHDLADNERYQWALRDYGSLEEDRDTLISSF